jgi:hypothetical protein
MGDFYRMALTTGDIINSFSSSQAKWLTFLRDEYGLYSAISDAGCFLLYSKQ